MVDETLYAHEYRCNRIALAEFKYDGPLTNPGGLVSFGAALAEREELEHELISPEIPFLVVVKEGFFFEFDAHDSWGNTISHFTDTFSLDDIRTLRFT